MKIVQLLKAINDLCDDSQYLKKLSIEERYEKVIQALIRDLDAVEGKVCGDGSVIAPHDFGEETALDCQLDDLGNIHIKVTKPAVTRAPI